jgi:hypothetical protein
MTTTKYRTVWTQKRLLYDNPEKQEDLDDYSKLEEEKMVQFPSFGNQTSISEIFNLWYLHTNFKITKRIFSLIKDFEGVEAVAPVSPYRMVVCFGHCFNCDIVRQKINKVLANILEEKT